MQFTLQVDRVASEWEVKVGKNLIHVDPAILDKYRLQIGEVVLLSTELTRYPIPARIGESYDADRGTGIVRLDRFLRRATKAKLNQKISLRTAGVLPPLESVTLMPPIDVSTAHGLIEHLSEGLISNRTPLGRDALVYATFRNSAAGTTYRVVNCTPEFGLVSATTNIQVEVPPNSGFHQDETVTFEDVGGRRDEISLIRELVQLPLQFPQIYRQLGIVAPRGIILYGPPGSGKTYLARAIANEINAGFYYINGPDIVGTMYGETEANMRSLFAEAAHHAPSVIVIDELDAVAPHREKAGTLSDVRMVTQLLSLLDGLMKIDGLVVIGTTNRVDAIDAAFRRPGRFDQEIFLGPPNGAGRLDILQIHTREMPLARETVEYLPRIAEVTHGFVGADLVELCRTAGLNALRRAGFGVLDHLNGFSFGNAELTVLPQDFENALVKVRPSAIREAFVTIPDVSWDDIGGMAEVKTRLRELVEYPMRQRQAIRSAGIANANGIVMFGPPGTGKTLLAKALANATGVNFLAIDGPEIFTKWLGESEEAIRHIFRVARQLAPSIIFFDQLDSLAPHRGAEGGSRTAERVVNQLLAEMDGVESAHGDVTVIAATNRIDLVDPSVLRPGRLGVHVEVPLPGHKDRLEILAIETRGLTFESDAGQLYERLAARTEGWSGAEIHSLCLQARMNAFRRADYKTMPKMTEADFAAALESLRLQTR